MEFRSSLTQEAASVMSSILGQASSCLSSLLGVPSKLEPKYVSITRAKNQKNNVFHNNLEYMELGCFLESMHDFKSEPAYMTQISCLDNHDFTATGPLCLPTYPTTRMSVRPDSFPLTLLR